MSLVPRHPDDRPGPALSDLPSLAVFGERLVAVEQRRVLRARRGASVVAALLGLLAALGTFTGAAAVALTATTGSPVPSFARGDDTGVFPEPGTSRVSDLRAPDPNGGLPWSVRVGRSRDGLVCIGVGQVQGRGFGIRGLDGRFRETPAVGNDACGPAPTSSAPVVSLRAFSGPDVGRPWGAVTVVHGSGGKGLLAAEVTTADGRRRRAALGRSGTFAIALGGWPEGASPTVHLTWKDGRTRTVALGPTDVLGDPSGLFGWSTEPIFAVHLRGRASPAGCVRLIGSRGRRSEGIACVPLTGSRARLERVAAPYGIGTRSAVTVRVRPRDRVVVRAGGREYRTVQTLTAAEPRRVIRKKDGLPGRAPDPGRGPRAAIAILPAGVAPSDVTVAIRRDGRDLTITPTDGAGR